MFFLRYGNYTTVPFLLEEAERAAGLLQSESLHMQMGSSRATTLAQHVSGHSSIPSLEMKRWRGTVTTGLGNSERKQTAQQSDSWGEGLGPTVGLTCQAQSFSLRN